MSNIRRFPGGEDESALERLNRHKSRKRNTRIMIGLIIIFAIFAIIFFYRLYLKLKKYESYELIKSVEFNQYSGDELVNFENTIMTYGKDGAQAVDSDGNLLWNQTFTMQYPLMAKSNDLLVFADYGGSTIYYQYKDGREGAVSTSMPIRKIAASSQGYVAAVLEDIDVTWIYMYDLNGTEISISRTTMEKSGYPIDIVLSPNGELMAVSFYYVDINDTKSTVAFFNFSEVGKNEIDNLVSSYNYADSVIPVVRFMTNGTSFALSSSRISFYKDEHKPVSQSEKMIYDEVLSVFYCEDAVAVIMRNNTIENKYRLELFSNKGEQLTSQEFNFDYTGVSFGNEHFVLYGGNHLKVVSYDGRLRYEGNYTEPISLVTATGSVKKYVVVTSSSIDTLELR